MTVTVSSWPPTIAALICLNLPKGSHHLRALKQQGLAASRRDGKLVFYSLTDIGVELLERVLEAVAASQTAIEAAR